MEQNKQAEDEQIQRHADRIKEIQADIKKEQDLYQITARVMLRQTGAIYNENGTYTMQEKDLIDWFKSGLHLRKYTILDIM